MALTPVSRIEDQDLGKILQIKYDSGVRDQLSSDCEEYAIFCNKLRKGDAEGRSQSFYLLTGRGHNSAQFTTVGSAAAFPDGHQVSTAEYEAVYKDIDDTVEIELNLWQRAKKGPKYAEPLNLILDAKADNQKRLLSIIAHGDGTGVVLQVGSAAISSGKVVVTASTSNSARGAVGQCEDGAKLLPKNADGTAAAPTLSAGTFSYYRVDGKDFQNGTVTLAAISTTGAVQTVTATGLTSGDVFYRQGQTTIVDLTDGDLTSSDDYNEITEIPAGLESITASDGRKCHGMTMSGLLAGSRYDAGGDPFDVTHIQRSMSLVKNRVGKNRFKWDSMLMAIQAADALIEGRETDRRFQSWKDGIRGTDAFGYVHGSDKLEILTSEFCARNRVWMIPTAKKSSDRVVEFWGAPFQLNQLNSQSQFFRPNSSGHDKMIQMYFSGRAAFLNKMPAAVNVITNFTAN